MEPRIEAFFHSETCSLSYVVADAGAKRAAIIDPVLDYERGTGRTRMTFAEKIEAYVREDGLTVDWILETHPHADHITAAQQLKERLGGQITIGSSVGKVQKLFKKIYRLGPEFAIDGSQFDHLLADGDAIEIGGLKLTAYHTPGHTSACMSYLVGDAVFVGDAILMPDSGSGRTDFPGGDAGMLFESIQRLYALPGETRMFVAHDYAPGGRGYAWETTVSQQREGNVHIRADTTKEEFISLREKRDSKLAIPELMVVAVPVNLRAGRFPPPGANGVS